MDTLTQWEYYRKSKPSPKAWKTHWTGLLTYGVNTMMAENKRYETAKECAGASIEALMTVYWADSFELEALESRIADLIYFFTRNARSLNEPHPNPEKLEGGENTP